MRVISMFLLLALVVMGASALDRRAASLLKKHESKSMARDAANAQFSSGPGFISGGEARARIGGEAAKVLAPAKRTVINRHAALETRDHLNSVNAGVAYGTYYFDGETSSSDNVDTSESTDDEAIVKVCPEGYDQDGEISGDSSETWKSPLRRTGSSDACMWLPSFSVSCLNTTTFVNRGTGYGRLYPLNNQNHVNKVHFGVDFVAPEGPHAVIVALSVEKKGDFTNFNTQSGTFAAYQQVMNLASGSFATFELPTPYVAHPKDGEVLLAGVFFSELNNAVFFIAGNGAKEKTDSLVFAPECGVNEPLTTDAIGFGNVHHIIDLGVDIVEKHHDDDDDDSSSSSSS